MVGGKLCRWLPTRGFGFISGDDSREAFIHIREFLRAGVDESQIRVGMKVMYDPAMRQDGKVYAKEVKLADTGAPKPDSFFKDIQKGVGDAR